MSEKENGKNLMDYHLLIKEAFSAREMSYSPYSKFKVGAALLSVDGEIFSGCNIENAAFTPTNCAERTALFKAVSQGVKNFSAIAVVGGFENSSEYCYPCGVCRQVLQEFCSSKDFTIIIAKNENEYKEYKLKDLLPHGFGPDDLI